MPTSRLSGFHRLSVSERIAELERLGWISAADAGALRRGRQVLNVQAADRMTENVVGVFGLPLSIAANFVVNGRECLLPLAVEEPSIVAALSSAALLARAGGGFSAGSDESLLAGQVHVVNVEDPERACAALRDAEQRLTELANGVHPRLLERGGGVRGIETETKTLPGGAPLLVVSVFVDTCDAMGANLVNTVCESIAPHIAAIAGGDAALRILSNLTDRSLFRVRVAFAPDLLAAGDMTGEAVRDAIVLANDIALVDPHRAATHNKGIMNGIDAVAIATGNDWRAIEAGAHAYAARDGRYRALTSWRVGGNGELLGELCLPLKAGTVGGTLRSNPAATLGRAVCGVQSARELAELMAAVGLAQNFAAIRALATSGIQQGHMQLHARSVAVAAGADDAQLDEVVRQLVASGDVKDWKARDIVEGLAVARASSDVQAAAAGKVILLGEHAVVYGHHALAVPLPGALRAGVSEAGEGIRVCAPHWGLSKTIDPRCRTGIDAAVARICELLDIGIGPLTIDIDTRLPMGKGLGSSAAFAVAVTRALASYHGIDVDDARVNEIAFACEQLAHGTPSGIDNAIACYERMLLYRRSDELEMQTVAAPLSLPLVLGIGHTSASTETMVAGVAHRRRQSPTAFDSLFELMSALSLDATRAVERGDFEHLGASMNVAHGLLNGIGVSTPELEEMVDVAREAGALGAKLTGAGGGGAIVALCPGAEDAVRSALQQGGYRTLSVREIEE